MSTARSWIGRAAALAFSALLAACGGGGDGSPSTTPPAGSSPSPVAAAANVVPISVDSAGGTAINAPFVTVTVCEPGTTNCRSIDHILLDTGSVGLRVEATALQGLSLPTVSAIDGGALGECAQFASGFTWGAVRGADVRLGGQQASALSVQVINDPAPAFATVPTACRSTGPALPDGGSNGILGVGFSVQDCGLACASNAATDVYFSCTATGCSAVAVPLATQVSNPVAALPTDNNGLAIVLPDVPIGGSPGINGSLVLGIGTQANNQLGGRTVFTANSRGNFTTIYKGQTDTAFIDSGSNGIFFADSTLPQCAGGSGFYCPPSPVPLTATVIGTNGARADVPFVVENASRLPAGTAAAHLGGTDLGGTFDWGLPFFFGRTVFVAITGRGTPAGPGPFWAF